MLDGELCGEELENAVTFLETSRLVGGGCSLLGTDGEGTDRLFAKGDAVTDEFREDLSAKRCT